MHKSLLKYWINVALFVDMCSMAVLGLLLAFVIPRGGSRGSAHTFLGLHRHAWGDIHLYLSLLLLVLLALHLWFNRTWIVQSTKRYFGDRWRNFLFILSGVWIVVLLVVWLVAVL